MADAPFDLSRLGDKPTPEERADYVLFRLEQFIRDNRTVAEGVNLRQWQAMAKVEIANAVAAAEMASAREKDDVPTKRLLFVAAAAMVTIGFWGTAVSLHRVGYLVGGIICLVAGLALFAVAGEWRLRRWWKGKRARERAKALARVENLNRRIKLLERELEKEVETLEEAIRKKKAGR